MGFLCSTVERGHSSSSDFNNSAATKNPTSAEVKIKNSNADCLELISSGKFSESVGSPLESV